MGNFAPVLILGIRIIIIKMTAGNLQVRLGSSELKSIS